MARDYKLTGSRRLLNTLIKLGLRFGLGPPGGRLLTVRGRKTGRDYTTPVNLVERDGRRLVIPAFRVGGHEIWGATAMVLAEFLALLDWTPQLS